MLNTIRNKPSFGVVPGLIAVRSKNWIDMDNVARKLNDEYKKEGGGIVIAGDKVGIFPSAYYILIF